MQPEAEQGHNPCLEVGVEDLTAFLEQLVKSLHVLFARLHNPCQGSLGHFGPVMFRPVQF